MYKTVQTYIKVVYSLRTPSNKVYEVYDGDMRHRQQRGHVIIYVEFE